MDLLAAEKFNGKLLDKAKVGALACFAIAGALLIASLFMPPPAQHATDAGASPGFAASVR